VKKITALLIQPNPTQPNPTHGWTQPMSISATSHSETILSWQLEWLTCRRQYELLLHQVPTATRPSVSAVLTRFTRGRRMSPKVWTRSPVNRVTTRRLSVTCQSLSYVTWPRTWSVTWRGELRVRRSPVNQCRGHSSAPTNLHVTLLSWRIDYRYLRVTCAPRLSWSKFCSRGVQPLPKAAYRSSCRGEIRTRVLWHRSRTR